MKLKPKFIKFLENYPPYGESRKYIYCKRDVPFNVFLNTAAVTDVRADASFMCDKAPVLGDTKNWTLYSVHNGLQLSFKRFYNTVFIL
jgi:hypothetical protein